MTDQYQSLVIKIESCRVGLLLTGSRKGRGGNHDCWEQPGSPSHGQPGPLGWQQWPDRCFRTEHRQMQKKGSLLLLPSHPMTILLPHGFNQKVDDCLGPCPIGTSSSCSWFYSTFMEPVIPQMGVLGIWVPYTCISSALLILRVRRRAGKMANSMCNVFDSLTRA